MSTPAPVEQIKSGEKWHDHRRIQRLVEEVSNRSDKVPPSRQSAVVDDKAKDMLMEYTVELTSSLIESANALAKHRGSKTIEPDDIKLILAKKLGIELPGESRIRSLHQHNLKSMYAPTAAKESGASAKGIQSSTTSIDIKKQLGTKRKLNA